jgi:DNA polymerase-3 subunit delta
MILKEYNLEQIIHNKNKFFLFYGKNDGAKNEALNKIILKNSDKKLYKYEEKEIIDNKDNFFNQIFSGSLFEKEKIILITNVTDKLFDVLNGIYRRNINDLIIIAWSDNLEKKSKLRNFFEKEKDLVCMPVYPDNEKILSNIAIRLLGEEKISLSHTNVNLIISKCKGDRGVLKNELNKIKLYMNDKKTISVDELIKLINLIENHDVSDLVENCLAKKIKKTLKILDENNFSSEDVMVIVRTFSKNAKNLLSLVNDYKKNNNLEKTIANAKPPIFWKNKEIKAEQIKLWTTDKLKKLIYSLNDLELHCKKDIDNSIHMISNFVIENCQTKTNY